MPTTKQKIAMKNKFIHMITRAAMKQKISPEEAKKTLTKLKLLITDVPALNQLALDSGPINLVPVPDTGICRQSSLMDKIRAYMALQEANSPKYNRKMACIKIGYPGKTKHLSQWLRDNYFLGEDDYPENSLLGRGIMDVAIKNIYKSVQYDSCSIPVSCNIYESPEMIKTIYTPLITTKGIEHFKRLFADELLLKDEVEKIKSNLPLPLNINYNLSPGAL